MCDPILLHRASNNEPNTYSQSTNHIAFILCTPITSQLISRCGILPFDTVKTTDHRSLYLNTKPRRHLRELRQNV